MQMTEKMIGEYITRKNKNNGKENPKVLRSRSTVRQHNYKQTNKQTNRCLHGNVNISYCEDKSAERHL